MKKPVILLLIVVIFGLGSIGYGQDDLYVVGQDGKRAVMRLAIKDVCAWPNLTQLADGTILANIFNKPSHGGVEGDIDCYGSYDQGKSWKKIGVSAPMVLPKTNRQHAAAGLAANGDVVMITTGLSHPEGYKLMLPAWISRSSDGGKTWTMDQKSTIEDAPFGDIVRADNGDLLAACYVGYKNWVYRSKDNGKSWEKEVEFAAGDETGNETAIINLGEGVWLAACRDEKPGAELAWTDPLLLYRSTDDGKSWKKQGHVTGAYQHPGHFLILKDGRLLLTYGNRIGGTGREGSRVEVRISGDKGKNWSKPRWVGDFNGFDGGYPSSVQLADGQVLTAYYANGSSVYGGYHMATVVWDSQKTEFDFKGQAKKSKSKNQKPLRFIFITTCVGEDFFKPVKKGMNDAAGLMNVECDFVGTEEVDTESQAQMVRKAVADGYDGIALNIIHPTAFDEVVREAIAGGVAVVAFNVDDAKTNNSRLSAVCQNLYQAGRTLGENASRFISKGSEILITVHSEGISALEDRMGGMQDVLKKKSVTWQVIATGIEAEKASEVITAELKTHPEIKTILCTGQADTEGAGLAIEKHFKGKGYHAAGFDLSPEILRLIKAGHIEFTIDQQPYVQGFYPVIQLTQYCRYGITPSDIDAGATIITQKTADEVMLLSKQGLR